MDGRTFIAVVGGSILFGPLAAEAQQTAKIPLIGFLGLASASSSAICAPRDLRSPARAPRYGYTVVFSLKSARRSASHTA